MVIEMTTVHRKYAVLRAIAPPGVLMTMMGGGIASPYEEEQKSTTMIHIFSSTNKT